MLSCGEERYFYLRFFFCLCPTVKLHSYHVAPPPLSCFMSPLPGKAVQQITKPGNIFLARGVLTQKRWAYPTNAHGQDVSSEIS